MKTKNVILTALMVVLVSGLAFAFEPGNPKLVVISQKSGIYKVIYEGGKAGKISMKIYDKDDNEVFSETTNVVNGFIRPVNFTGMEPGEYTIEIADGSGKHIQKVTYAISSSIKSVHIAKTSEDGKYLMAIANSGKEVINVRIFDGANNLVHDQQIAINGDFGLVYNLKNVAGTPSFEVSDKVGIIVNK
jgi:hypothetical protein